MKEKYCVIKILNEYSENPPVIVFGYYNKEEKAQEKAIIEMIILIKYHHLMNDEIHEKLKENYNNFKKGYYKEAYERIENIFNEIDLKNVIHIKRIEKIKELERDEEKFLKVYLNKST